MTTKIFSKQEFERAIPKQFVSIGMLKGEECYLCKITDDIHIMLRSTVGASGYCKDTGEDSIRFWLVGNDLKPLGARISKRVNRVPGWQERLIPRLRELWALAQKVGYCPDCKVPRKLFRVKKAGNNRGKLFATCKQCNKRDYWEIIEQE